jgi:two-component system NtrC family sensor kinase
MAGFGKRKLLAGFSKHYRSLKWRIVAVLLAAALLPLLLAGFGSWVVFRDLLERKSFEQMRQSVKNHSQAIEAYLSERLRLVQVISENRSPSEIADPVRFQALFDNLNRISERGFIDLGIIGEDGDHISYIGPYDLITRNYREAEWFKEVIAKGRYVSDVFLGFRQVPHCVVAVRSSNENKAWILRATINSAQFDELVRAEFLADGSDAFIINREGRYQTTPRKGNLLDPSPLRNMPSFTGIRDSRVEMNGEAYIRVMTWLNENRWLLVVQQPLATVNAPVDQAIARGAYIVLVAVFILVLTTILATWHLSRQIDRVTAERESISKAFLRSAKLASIGEMTTGLAHEINNPLAIMSAEQTNIADIIKDPNSGPPEFTQVLESAQRCQSQIQRCAAITRKLLQFGRIQETHVRPISLAPRLTEIHSLMERQAGLRNINMELHIDESLPPVLADPIEIEQVIVNLINNAFDAMPEGGLISIRAILDMDKVLIEVADTGAGISSEDLDRVFEPFFTTKPIGKGTGLGLSVCYGIVRSWGGEIEISSRPGDGTAVRLILSFPGA